MNISTGSLKELRSMYRKYLDLDAGLKGRDFELVHISSIRVDDVAILRRDGEIVTVGRGNFHHDNGFRYGTLCGDSYDCGYKPVARVLRG